MRFFWLLLAVLCVSASFLLGYLMGSGKSNGFLSGIMTQTGSQDSASFGLLDEVWNLVEKRYVHQPVDKEEAIFGAARGLVESLKDPYTVFLSPKESESFQQEIDGTFEGIGAEIGIKDERLVVIAPLPESPAEKAGLLAGDHIEAIDDQETVGLPLDEAVNKIRGKKGTSVTLTVQRTPSSEASEIAIIRDTITVESVQLSYLDGNIAHLKLTYFGPNTANDFRAAANQIILKDVSGIILDMRSNPGGYLTAAVDVAGQFLEKDAVVVYERLTDGTKTPLTINADGMLRQIPLVVLVDGGSASGSEIVAGALQDYAVGKLVGKTTFGKGSVQQLEQLDGGANLKLTVAEWLTPKERSINEKGIEPDVIVERTAEDYEAGRDPQLDKAVELLNQSQ